MNLSKLWYKLTNRPKKLYGITLLEYCEEFGHIKRHDVTIDGDVYTVNDFIQIHRNIELPNTIICKSSIELCTTPSKLYVDGHFHLSGKDEPFEYDILYVLYGFSSGQKEHLHISDMMINGYFCTNGFLS